MTSASLKKTAKKTASRLPIEGRRVRFVKMAGAGNDFLVIESSWLPRGVSLPTLTRRICNRSRGVGADGVLVLGPSKRGDVRLRIINADGTEAEMCGNGARCAALYAKTILKKSSSATLRIETIAGLIEATVEGSQAVLRLSDPENMAFDKTIMINGRRLVVHSLDTGVPHAVVFVADLDRIPVDALGRLIRRHPAFKPRGTNADFVEELGPGRIAVRTFERGVEGETLACGTGCTAAALVYLWRTMRGHPFTGKTVKVQTRSGEILTVKGSWDGRRFFDAILAGRGQFIAEGEFFLSERNVYGAAGTETAIKARNRRGAS